MRRVNSIGSGCSLHLRGKSAVSPPYKATRLHRNLDAGHFAFFIAVAFTLWSFAWAAFSSAQDAKPDVSNPLSQPKAAEVWRSLQERSPFPYALPLPHDTPSGIDGFYVKNEPIVGERVHCLRCPDWIYEGGLWKIHFSQGVYRILHIETLWKSIGSFRVSRDRLILFNDPACTDDIGVYRWKLENGALTFQVIDDPCAIRLRGKNLEHIPWKSCRPPNIEAAVTGHWPIPQGCE